MSFQYAEGGGPLPPYRESFLENVLAVSWQSSGGVFVSGDFCCYERYAIMERFDSDQLWLPLGSMAFTDGGGTFASTYAKVNGKPTLVLGGENGNGQACIMYSHDGSNWQNAGAGAAAMGSNIDGLVWDANPIERDNSGNVVVSGRGLFYANATRGDGRCFYSPDGAAWYFSYGRFEDHCKYVIPGVPDGIYGYDARNDLVIFPGDNSYPYLDGLFYEPNKLQPDKRIVYVITNASTDNAQIFTQETGLDSNRCVAFCGGIWIVGGEADIQDNQGPILRSGTAASIDSGFNWTLVSAGKLGMTGDYAVETVMGGPYRDFKKFLNK